MKKITAKTHKKTLLTLLDSMRGYELLNFEWKYLSQEEKNKIQAKNLTNEILNLKELIKQKYLQEFKLYAIELFEKEVAEKKRLAEIKAYQRNLRKQDQKLTAEDHFNRLFNKVDWNKCGYNGSAEYYEVIHGIRKPKIERGFTEQELKKLGLKTKKARNRIATEQELLKEQIFEFAEDLSNEMASKNERAYGSEFTREDDPLNEPFMYNKKGDFTVRGGCYIANDTDASYHLNERHTKYIENEVKNAKENYYLFELTDEEREQFANFAEWEASKDWKDPEEETQGQLPFSEKERKSIEYLNDKHQEEWEDWYEYEHRWIQDNDNYTSVHFEITLDGNYVVLTAAYGINCIYLAGDTDCLRLAFKVDDVKRILEYNAKPETIVHELLSYQDAIDRLADIIYKRVQRDNREPSVNKLYKKIYAQI